MKLYKKIADARGLISPLAKTEVARRGHRSAVEWTFAPSHVVHEAATSALRSVGLELMCHRWTVRSGILAGDFVLVDVATGEADSWTSELPVDASSVGPALGACGALALLIRHTRLTLLDMPCVPAEEEHANRRAYADARAGARHRVLRSMGPPSPAVELDPDDEPAWMVLPPEVSEEEIIAAEIGIAAAEEAIHIAADMAEDEEILERLRGEVTEAWLDARRRGATLDLVDVMRAAIGEARRPSELDADDWRKVLRAVKDAP